MKFLALHGAIGHRHILAVQLHPLEQELEQAATFHCIDGPCTVNPPEGFADYFGIGPHYRWFDDAGLAQEGMLLRIRQLPDGDTPEEVMRGLAVNAPKEGNAMGRNYQQLLDYLYATMEADPEIQGVLGYSEGASLAGSLVLNEWKRFRDEGRPRQLKCAIFFTGWPPLRPDDERLLLRDESDITIDIPTLHIIGANDPYKDGALALYSVCEQDKAVLFDTGMGHTIPRSGQTLRELSVAIREMMAPLNLK